MTDLLTQVNEALQQAGMEIAERPLITYIASEDEILESTPMRSVDRNEVQKLLDLKLSNNDGFRQPLIFIDGTMQLARINEGLGEITLNDEKLRTTIPIHVAQIAVGASFLDPNDNVMRPITSFHFFVLLAPFKLIGINVYDLSNEGLFVLGPRDDNETSLPRDSRYRYLGGRFRYIEEWKRYNKENKIPVFLSDTSMRLRLGDMNLAVDISDKKAIYGMIWRRAQDRAKVLMRIAELYLYRKIIRKREWYNLLNNTNRYILMDGPPIQLSKYLQLIDRDLNLYFDENKRSEYYSQAWRFMRFLVGATKFVRIIPSDLELYLWESRFFKEARETNVWVYWMPHVARGEAEKRMTFSKLLISAFYTLRPSVVERFAQASPYFGITRIDIPIPAIMDEESFREYYVDALDTVDEELDVDQIKKIKEKNKYAIEILEQYLSQKSSAQITIKQILNGLRNLSYPLPPRKSVNIQRWAVELYPIYWTEKWIKSKLLPKKFLKAIFANEATSLREKIFLFE